MHPNIFSVKKFEGTSFAKFSGDNNIIHINKIAGHNSIYGHNIVHGVLIILKFFKKIQFKKNYSHIKIIFLKGFKYNSEIKIRKIKKNKYKFFYELIQQKNIYASIEINFLEEKNQIQNLKKVTFKKNYIISKKIIKKFSSRFFPKELKIYFCFLT